MLKKHRETAAIVFNLALGATPYFDVSIVVKHRLIGFSIKTSTKFRSNTSAEFHRLTS